MTVRKLAKPMLSNEKTARTEDAPGLRERKRQQTRERLTAPRWRCSSSAALKPPRCDDIAAAADISRRNFFHYFASREDVVFAMAGGGHGGAGCRGGAACW